MLAACPIDGGATGHPEEKVFEDLIQVHVVEGLKNKKMFFLVRSSLSEKERGQMVELLRENIYVFVWKPYEMPGIHAEVMCHRLHINPSFKLIKQKLKRSAPEKAKAVEE